MGALHAGHASLMAEARRHADHVAVSIFVNPTQFGPKEDFHRYPRPIEDDLALCEQAGVDLVFHPSLEVMYPPGVPGGLVSVPVLASMLEGFHRPGHFAGVCQVVAKLFNIVGPQVACFGEKDFQQLAILTAMTRALDFPIDIIPCPTLREQDGLAMSSRNRYLSDDERKRGLSISRSLFQAARLVREGQTDARIIREAILNVLNDAAGLPQVTTKLDYASIVDRNTLEEVDHVGEGGAQAVVAMFVGKTRLIDNVALTLT
jgi:pantoate--beta-alanine ligase